MTPFTKNEKENLVKIRIGIHLPDERGGIKRSMSIWVDKEDVNQFDLIHKMAVENEAKNQADEIVRSIISKATFKLLGI